MKIRFLSIHLVYILCLSMNLLNTCLVHAGSEHDVHLHEHEEHSHDHDTQEHEHGDHDDHQDEVKGPHGGRLLIDGNAQIELAIFENGVDPHYRAWITLNGNAVKSTETDLSVTLTRLGGKTQTFTFTAKEDFWLGSGAVEEPHSFDAHVELDIDGKHYDWNFESYEGRIVISENIARQAQINTKKIGSGNINQTVPVYGKTVFDSSKVSHIQARFPGTVIQVKVNIGDTVKKGDTLAEVESNESLKRYTISAPFAGIITARHANAGELTQDKTLFTLIDNSELWAELHVFPGQQSRIHAGQPVNITSQEFSLKTVVAHVVPSDNGEPYIIARALVTTEKQKWTPGLLVKGMISTQQDTLPLVIDNRALQSFRDWTVAFIKVNETYEIRPLELGRSDGEFTEVISGLVSGDEYVVENSFLIKADIEKSGASHEH